MCPCVCTCVCACWWSVCKTHSYSFCVDGFRFSARLDDVQSMSSILKTVSFVQVLPSPPITTVLNPPPPPSFVLVLSNFIEHSSFGPQLSFSIVEFAVFVGSPPRHFFHVLMLAWRDHSLWSSFAPYRRQRARSARLVSSLSSSITSRSKPRPSSKHRSSTTFTTLTAMVCFRCSFMLHGHFCGSSLCILA